MSTYMNRIRGDLSRIFEQESLIEKIESNVAVLLYHNSVSPILESPTKETGLYDLMKESIGNHIEISSLLRLSDWMDVLDNNTIMVDPSTVSKKIRFVQYQNTNAVQYLSKFNSKAFIKQAIKTELQLLESIDCNTSLGCCQELVANAYKQTN